MAHISKFQQHAGTDMQLSKIIFSALPSSPTCFLQFCPNDSADLMTTHSWTRREVFVEMEKVGSVQ